MLSISKLLDAVFTGLDIIVSFWNNVKDWILKAVDKVAKLIKGIVYGVKFFIKRVGKVLQEISRHYSKDKAGQWEETTVTRKVSPNDVPADIRMKAGEHETDITHDMELQLTN